MATVNVRKIDAGMLPTVKVPRAQNVTGYAAESDSGDVGR